MLITTLTNQAEKNVGMGQVFVARAGETLGAVLGSCIGLVICHPRLRIGAMAHIVLPTSSGRPGPPGKFADSAIPHMIDLLAEAGAPRAGLVAKQCGGARMFGAEGPSRIGDNNVEAVSQILKQRNIRVVGENLGGKRGRRVIWDPQTGDLTIHIVGKPPKTI